VDLRDLIEAHYLTSLIAARIMALLGSGVVDVDVAIVGGGIGGPALALALQKVGITSVAVFERDASHDERSQGYGLTSASLHPTLCTLHPTPYTLHSTPYTLHPTPYTLHPSPYTIHHTGLAPPALAAVPSVLFLSGKHFLTTSTAFDRLQQGSKVSQKLGLKLHGISSCSHYSLLPDGEMLGWYGRELLETRPYSETHGHKYVLY